MIFPFDRKDGFRDASTPRPTQRPASNSEARKREHHSGIRPSDGAFGQQLAGPDPHLDNGFAEVIREAKEKAWDEAHEALCDYSYVESQYPDVDVSIHSPNPYRSAP